MCKEICKNGSVYSFGIYVSNLSGTAAVTPTSTGGRSEFIKVSGNTILNCYGGVQLRGYASATPYDLYDKYNEIGVDSANTITGFGGGSSIAYGIYVIYQDSLQITKNILESATGTVNTLYGIFTSTATNASLDIANNMITVHGGGTTQTIYGISNAAGGTGTANTVNIRNNTITNCTYTTATTGDIQAIVNTASAYKSYIYENTISNNVLSCTTTGIFYGIFQSGTVVNESNVYNNKIFNNSKPTGTTGAFYGINLSPAATATSIIDSNFIYNNSTNAGIIYGIYQTTGDKIDISKNVIYGLTSNSAAGGAYGIAMTGGITNNLFNNFISDLNTPAGTIPTSIFISTLCT